MTAYRKFQKWNIGFRNRERLFPVLPIVKKKKKLMPTDPRFFWHVTVNTHIFFFGLIRPDFRCTEIVKYYKITSSREVTSFIMPLHWEDRPDQPSLIITPPSLTAKKSSGPKGGGEKKRRVLCFMHLLWQMMIIWRVGDYELHFYKNQSIYCLKSW